jgi:GNAT superfamily N-acetyltransferase
VRTLDRYPPFDSDDGYREFFFGTAPIAAWVAERDGALIGHVAVHDRSLTETMALASRELGSSTAFGVVARLLVSPDARGQHVGETLLDVASRTARERGLVPILDTVSRLAPAVALYERTGWTRIGEFPFTTDGEDLTVYVYAHSPA